MAKKVQEESERSEQGSIIGKYLLELKKIIRLRNGIDIYVDHNIILFDLCHMILESMIKKDYNEEQQLKTSLLFFLDEKKDHE